MSDTVVINPRYNNILSQYGFGSLESFLSFKDGQIMDKNRKRCVYKFRLKDPETNKYKTFYLKQFHKPSFKRDLLKFLEFGLPVSEAKTEWMNACMLIEEGFHTIPLVAYGERKVLGVERSSFFLSEEIPNARCLADWFLTCSDTILRRRVLLALADTVRRMHGCKLSYPDLYMKHVYLNEKSISNGSFRFVFLDLHRLRKKRRLSFQSRIRDLAAFCFSALPVFKDEEMLLFLNKYLEDQPDSDKWINAVTARIKRLKVRRTHTKGVLARECVSGDGRSHLFVNEHYFEDFVEQGINNFYDLYTFPVNSDKLTDNPGRTVETIDFISRNRRCTLYIKKHENCGLKIIKERSRVEWKNHLICERLGIAVPTLVAWGYACNPSRSCLVTHEIENCLSLEKIVQMGCLPANFEQRRVLIMQIASIARNLHEKGYCHKDFYAGHLLIRTKSLTDFSEAETYLIDLQRIAKLKLFKWRWRIKDLSQLDFTTRYPEIRLKDRLRFMHEYLGCKKLSKEHRALLAKISAKTDRIRRHIPKVLRRKNIDSWDQVT
ncbi:MAG: lipopolysaccharide kinase InaA family protein [Candidatus Auribacterota bacterium]|jgi:tRNA A-37 threonylcarbamoyl transferase component Bud32|nr:lipopolysaccharide kinase InaA family protein [Candidatus Auribacterota bacterium]